MSAYPITIRNKISTIGRKDSKEKPDSPATVAGIGVGVGVKRGVTTKSRNGSIVQNGKNRFINSTSLEIYNCSSNPVP